MLTNHMVWRVWLLVVFAFALALQAQDATTPAQAGPPGSPTQTSGQPPPAVAEGASVSAQELANQVNNPAAPVTFVQFRNILIPSFPGFKGALNSLQMQPVLPIGPFESFPYVQLVKITFPMVSSTPGVAPRWGASAASRARQV